VIQLKVERFEATEDKKYELIAALKRLEIASQEEIVAAGARVRLTFEEILEIRRKAEVPRLCAQFQENKSNRHARLERRCRRSGAGAMARVAVRRYSGSWERSPAMPSSYSSTGKSAAAQQGQPRKKFGCEVRL